MMRKFSVMVSHHWHAIFWDSIPQEADDGIDKFTEGRVVTVVGDVLMHDAP
jgi:hypothetical protein